MAHTCCMLSTYTLWICNIYCFSIATMVMQILHYTSIACLVNSKRLSYKFLYRDVCSIQVTVRIVAVSCSYCITASPLIRHVSLYCRCSVHLGYGCLFNQYKVAKTLKYTFLNRAWNAFYINMWHLESGSYTKETMEVQSHQ
jgi:hypothetical protein